MILADTSIWIEFFRANQPFHGHITALIEDQQIVAVECIFGELLRGARSEKEIAVIQGYFHNLPKLSQDGIWLEAGVVSGRGKWFAKGVGLIDLALAVAAKRAKARIWTLDKKLLTAIDSALVFEPKFV